MKFPNDFFKKFRKDKKVFLIIGIGILGMLLLLFSETGGKEEKGASDVSFSSVSAEREIEERLEKLLSTVDGVGKVKVMVTLDGSCEDIYALDSEIKGEARSDEYVIVEDGGDDTGLKLRTLNPAVRGVGVSCEGASNASVREDVTSLVCAVLGVKANKVFVAQLSNSTSKK